MVEYNYSEGSGNGGGWDEFDYEMNDESSQIL